MDKFYKKDDKFGAVGRPKGSGSITAGLKKLMKSDTGDALMSRINQIILNEKTSTRDFLDLVKFITDRLEGKAVSTELHGDLNNPLLHIDTATLIAKLEAIKTIPEPIELEVIPEENNEKEEKPKEI